MSEGTLPKQPTRFYQRYVDAAQHTGKTLWDWANKRTNSYVTYLAQALKNFSTQGATEAVVFGYWAMFSLFPLVMLGVVIAANILGPDNAKAQVFALLRQYFPSGGSQLIRENIEQAISQRGSFGIVSILGLVYGSTGLFTNLQYDLSRIFRDKRQRHRLIQIVIGVVMIVALALLIMASLLTSAIFSAVSMEFMGDQTPLLKIGGTVIPLVINTLMFFLMFRLVPQRKISRRAIWPGALLAAFIWEIGKNLFGWYVTNLANFGLVYGSLGTVIGLLTWTYLTGALISLCAEIAVATDDWLHRKPPAVAVVVPCVNKPANELPPDAPGQVLDVQKPEVKNPLTSPKDKQ
jgi:YihY family inner membrane protein